MDFMKLVFVQHLRQLK